MSQLLDQTKGFFWAGKYARDVNEVKEKTDPEYYMTEAFRGDFFVFWIYCLSAEEIVYTPV